MWGRRGGGDVEQVTRREDNDTSGILLCHTPSGDVVDAGRTLRLGLRGKRF